jgi:hypothetical protein
VLHLLLHGRHGGTHADHDPSRIGGHKERHDAY